MAFKDLRSYVEELEKRGRLNRVKTVMSQEIEKLVDEKWNSYGIK